jgi:hypothetical protein
MLSISLYAKVPGSVVNATTNGDYYDEEKENNDSISAANSTPNIITSERVMIGRFTSTSDNYDYYKVYISSNNSIYIQLSGIPGGCDYDLYLYDQNGSLISSSLNSADVGEWIETSINTSGYYYICVKRYSGYSNFYYRLYTEVNGVKFNQSFYIKNVNSDNWMYWLGRDHTNSVSGLVFLSFGAAVKINNDYGIRDLGVNYANMSRVKTAVEKFIQGYNDNPKHTADIRLIVAINNRPPQNYKLPDNNDEYFKHGAYFKNMINSISPSGHVKEINGGIDAELDWNTPTLTKAWVDGFSKTGNFEWLYNFGDHAGRTDDFSGETDPSFNNNWRASDVYYISYGNTASLCTPEIYSQGCAQEWVYQKKWSLLHGYGQYYEGLLSTNGFDGYYRNQESYSAFYNFLQQQGYGEALENRTWIALTWPAQP